MSCAPWLVPRVEPLWEPPTHERRMAAVALLELHAELLSTRDLPLVERLLRQSKTWALGDGLAADVGGGVLACQPAETTAVLDRWAADPDFWIRRSSLLAELLPVR